MPPQCRRLQDLTGAKGSQARDFLKTSLQLEFDNLKVHPNELGYCFHGLKCKIRAEDKIRRFVGRYHTPCPIGKGGGEYSFNQSPVNFITTLLQRKKPVLSDSAKFNSKKKFTFGVFLWKDSTS